MNVEELRKQIDYLKKVKEELEIKENTGIRTEPKNKIYILDKKYRVVDTKETRINQIIQEVCTHPVLWVVNYQRRVREYYDRNNTRTNLWYYCMHCGKLITEGIEPETDYVITAPDDIKYVYYFRRNLLPEFQEEYDKILEGMEGEVDIDHINLKLNEKFSKQKVKK